MPDIIIVAFIGLFGAVLGALIGAFGNIIAAKIKNQPSSQEPMRKISLRYGIIIGAVGGIILGILLVQLVNWGQSLLRSNKIPLSIVQYYDFESYQDSTNTKPWHVIPDEKSHQLILSDEEAHSGKSSLRLKVSIQPLYTDQYEYGGIGIFRSTAQVLEKSQVIAGSAWVLIPAGEAVQNNEMFAHIIGYVYDEESYMGVYSEDVKLTPGVWTPIFWGATYTTEFQDFTFLSSDRKLNEFYISVWDDSKSYDGSIYFDDIVLYTCEK